MQSLVHIPATSQLAEYVTAIWELFGGHTIKETILPQGVVEMVFNLGDPMMGGAPGVNFQTAPRCFIQGVNTTIVEVSYAGQQHLFGIRIHPGMIKSLLGIFPAELKNIQLDLTLVKPQFNRLWHQLIEAKSFEARVEIIKFVFPALSDDVCLRTQKLCSLFLEEGLQNFQSIQGLSEQVYYSTRHLNRKTQSLFGISAEELITYKKYLHAVKLMHYTQEPLTSIAYDSGFFDQAHFCHIFKLYAGITPKQYRQQKSELPYHLFPQV
ncbi:MAG TPA: helix-turn-helix transcriptional regulator [Segetibacter sp.]|jgi:AraC-like DNA-binding protein